jgi:hypothetical protein
MEPTHNYVSENLDWIDRVNKETMDAKNWKATYGTLYEKGPTDKTGSGDLSNKDKIASLKKEIAR